MCWHHSGWSPLSRGARLVAPAIAVLLTVLGGGLAPATSALGPVEQAGTPAVGLTPVFTGLERPVFVTHAGDGTNRLFVVEQPGRIRVAVNGVLLATPYLDITTLVASDPVRAAEQGLLGLAFHPQYATNGRFYVYYTAKPNGANRLVRYRVSGDPNRADDSTALELFSIPDRFTNHNGGMLAFGPDGLLYVG